MRNVLRRVSKASGNLWQGLRAWCGDSAYESYLRSRAVRSVNCSPLSREEFYVQQLNRRYSRPNRCC